MHVVVCVFHVVVILSAAGWFGCFICPYSLGLIHRHRIIIWLPECQRNNPEGYGQIWPVSNHGKTKRNAIHALQWRHNGCDGVSNHQPHNCLLNRLFGRRRKKRAKLRVTGHCAGIHRGPVNSPHKWPVTRIRFPFDDVIIMRNTPERHGTCTRALVTLRIVSVNERKF